MTHRPHPIISSSSLSGGAILGFIGSHSPQQSQFSTPRSPKAPKRLKQTSTLSHVSHSPRSLPHEDLGPNFFRPILPFFPMEVSLFVTIKGFHLEWPSLPRQLSPGRAPSRVRPVVNERYASRTMTEIAELTGQVKCNGASPSCSRCAARGEACVYSLWVVYLICAIAAC
jgi:hypothetical protein